MALITLRKSSDKSPAVIEEKDIIVGYSSTNGTKIEYVNSQTGRRDTVEVDSTVAAVIAVSTVLFPVVFRDYTSGTGFLNYNRIYEIFDDSDSKAVVLYDRGTTLKGRYELNGTRTATLVAMYTKQGYLTYAVESYGTLTIVLPAATGDVSAKFQNGEILTIFGALNANNGTYVVNSAAFGGGKTTITLLTTGVATTSDTTGYVMVKS